MKSLVQKAITDVRYTMVGFFMSFLFKIAAHFKVPQIMEFLIQLAYHCYNKQFTELINIRTKNGHSPAILCVIYKSVDCLQLLLDYGGVDMQLKDIKQRTILQIADAHKSDECKKLLQEKSGQQDKNGIIPINKIKLLNIPSLKELLNTMNKDEKEELQKACSPQIEIEKYHDLLLLGDRIPCVICLSDEGYIKYTTCCGQPIHSLCKSAKIVKCPYCGEKKFELTAEIYFPERAFQLPNVEEDEPK